MSVHDHSAHVAEEAYRKSLRKDFLHGALAGVLAGAAMMILFFAYDMLSFKPLATPDFLSSALLGGGEPNAETAVKLRTARIAGFTTFHLLVFTVLGITLARFLRFTGLKKTLLAGGLYGLIVCTAIFNVSMQVTGTQLAAATGWPALLAGNFAAGIVMVAFLRRAEQVDPSN
ncbi:MAG: hypothetical protein WBO43_00400 [Gemmatimonadota bacterium]|jgi:hypothetical protein